MRIFNTLCNEFTDSIATERGYIMKCVVIVLLTIFLLCTGCTENTNGGSGIEDSVVDSSVPHGTYTATYIGRQQTAKFNGDTLELYNELDGKRTYVYTIIDGGSAIRLTKVGTGETLTGSFSYHRKYDLVIINDHEYHRD